MVGESGSGKSVLTKTFTGMLKTMDVLLQGSIDYRGQDLTASYFYLRNGSSWLAKITTIFQDPMTSLGPNQYNR